LINLLFLGHNFWTRNARKLIKGSTDSVYRLESNKNLSQKIGSCGWGPGPNNLSQNCLSLPSYEVTHKNQNPKLSNFLKSNLEDMPHLLRV